MTPGPSGPERLAALVADTSCPESLRLSASGNLGWRKDATAAQKDAVLAYLLPLLGDAKTRGSVAGILQPAYAYGHGLWHNEPRVLEAAKTALAAEQAQPQPDKAVVAALEKIVKGQP
ncbi:MAG: hypothetical protein ACKOEX_13335 [Planctomycetia bacterium]